jgi:hypothetical protein
MSDTVRLVTRQDEPGEKRALFYCPGCQTLHQYRIAGKRGPVWEFNGDLQKPTFSPSLKMERDGKTCHLFLKDGKIEYCHDCSHSLAGQIVDCPPVEIWS